MHISDEDLRAWRRDGYVLLPNFISADEVAAAQSEAASYFPTGEEYQLAPRRYPQLAVDKFAFREFPYVGETLNRLSVHADVLDAVERALGTDEIALATSLLWAKYGGAADYDQSHHVDYGNNSLVHPRDDGIFTQMPFILYLTDVTVDLGPTYVVPQTLTGTAPELIASGQQTRAAQPGWYEAEKPVAVSAGTLLLYTMRTYHRGSAMKDPRGYRLSLHFVYRALACQWMGWRAWARDGQDPELHRFITHASPRQRQLLGFPAPGHAYWTDETLSGVAARYPGMDMSPYQGGLRAAS